MRIIKKILTGIGIFCLLCVGIIMLVDGSDNDGTYVTESGTEVKSGTNPDDDSYYSLVLESGEKVNVLIPQTIFEDKYKNLSEQRKESIFSSIYNYDHDADVYVNYIPDAEQTLKEMLKEPYAVGSVFSFSMSLTGGPVDNEVSGYIQGEDSVGMIHVDTSYIGDEKYDFMDGDTASFDVVYAGLDTASTPMFIVLAYTY